MKGQQRPKRITHLTVLLALSASLLVNLPGGRASIVATQHAHAVVPSSRVPGAGAAQLPDQTARGSASAALRASYAQLPLRFERNEWQTASPHFPLRRANQVANSGTWSPTGSMTTARTFFTTTLLPNGKVLVAGGDYRAKDDTETTLASAELYDPATGIWTATGSMTVARESHTATLLPNGKVLVTGGCLLDAAFVPEATAELYDPATSTWAETGPMHMARQDHIAILLPSGKVFVVGGDHNTGRSAAWFILRLEIW